MKRSWTLWVVFSGCAAIVFSALAWVTLVVLRLDEAASRSRQSALLEENTRLALWRMESMLAPFVAIENVRPYHSYQSFFPAAKAHSSTSLRAEQNEGLFPSPLLTEGSPYVRLYFQLGSAGQISSPQIPSASLPAKLRDSYFAAAKVEESNKWLQQFAGNIPKQALFKVAPFEWLPMDRPLGTDVRLASNPDTDLHATPTQNARESANKKNMPQKDTGPESQSITKEQLHSVSKQDAIKNSPDQVADKAVTLPEREAQQLRNAAEYQARISNIADLVSLNLQRSYPNQGIESKSLPQQSPEIPQKQVPLPNPNPAAARTQAQGNPPPQSSPPEIKTSLLKPVWIDNELILVRRVQINKDEYLQGCWIDWPQLQKWLITGIRDLLPNAQLSARRDGTDQARSLAALPIYIQPGPISAAAIPPVSAVRFSLWVTWLCVIAAVMATAVLLWGTHLLSERRAAFVSAVTHELRTPLTTFRIYTEMLAEGMVPDEARRRQYLSTLSNEAERQYHLIENVLAYSRLEKGRYGGQKESICLGAWLKRLQPRLSELAERSAMTLVPADESLFMHVQITTDAAALERIFFNLIDNACKYARTAEDKRIHIEVTDRTEKISIRIIDHGPGISRQDIAKLFKPFHKSAREAANSAPGVGLGLSLCRRLAKSIGADLVLESNSGSGASFQLLLPYKRQRHSGQP